MVRDKVVIITGSSKGIGKQTALTFAKAGANIVINSNSSENEGRALAEEIKQIGRKSSYIKADISSPEDVENLINQTIKEMGQVDVLVNNAGIHKPKPFFQLTVDDWEKIFKINMTGLFLCSQKAAEKMLEQGSGKIINVASVRGLDYCGRPDNIDYSASKAAVINFTRSLAKGLAPKVQVNAVAPGPTDTGINIWTEDDMEKTYLKRLIKPEEIAEAILFLASSKNDVITGEILVVDGGYSLL